MNISKSNETFEQKVSQFNVITPYVNSISFILGIIFIFGIILNLVSIVAILYSNKQRAISIFILNLALADLVYTAGIPLFMTHVFKQSWPFGLVGCRAFLLTDLIGVIVSVFTVTALSVERYFEVTDKKKRLENLGTSCRTYLTYIYLLVVWLFAFVFSMPMIMSISLEQTEDNSFMCETNWTEKKINHFFVIKFVFIFALPFCVITFSSLKLWLYLRNWGKTSKRRRKSQNKRMLMNGKRVKRSKKTRMRQKATKIVLSIVFLFFLQWTPFWLAELYKTVTNQPIVNIQLVNEITTMISYTNAISNPLLYMLLTHDFKKHVTNYFINIKNLIFG